MTYSQLSRLERGRAQTRGIKKPERRRHKLAFTVAKITKDTEVMPLANEQGAFAPGRMTFRPAFPQQPRLADELAGFIGAGGKWDLMNQIREEVYFTKGRVIVRGQLSTRGEPKRADYILSHKPGIRLAIVEAKDNNHPVGSGIQQALAYAETLDVPFVFSSNGDAFVFHDRTGLSHPVERVLTLHEFPSPGELWSRYRAWKGLSDEADKLARVPWRNCQLIRLLQMASCLTPNLVRSLAV